MRALLVASRHHSRSAVRFGGLHIACDCFAVLHSIFSSFSLPIRCARSMSLMIFSSRSLVSSKFVVTVALPMESFPPRFFLGWPKQR